MPAPHVAPGIRIGCDCNEKHSARYKKNLKRPYEGPEGAFVLTATATGPRQTLSVVYGWPPVSPMLALSQEVSKAGRAWKVKEVLATSIECRGFPSSNFWAHQTFSQSVIDSNKSRTN